MKSIKMIQNLAVSGKFNIVATEVYKKYWEKLASDLWENWEETNAELYEGTEQYEYTRALARILSNINREGSRFPIGKTYVTFSNSLVAGTVSIHFHSSSARSGGTKHKYSIELQGWDKTLKGEVLVRVYNQGKVAQVNHTLEEFLAWANRE